MGSQKLLFDGIIFSPLGLSQEKLRLRDTALPLVLLGERASEGTFDHVGINDVVAARDATTHLIEIGSAPYRRHRRSTYETGEAAQLRTRGYRQAHALAGMEVDESLVVCRPRFNRADGAEAMTALLDRPDPPDAVFCYSDLVAVGAIRVLLSRGIRVPEDVAVVGYDDIEEGTYSTPSITTISPDKKLIAETAVSRLLFKNREGRKPAWRGHHRQPQVDCQRKYCWAQRRSNREQVAKVRSGVSSASFMSA